MIKSMNFLSRQQTYLNIHFPENLSQFEKADFRLKFEESFFFQLGFGLKKAHHKTKSQGNPFPIIGDYFTGFMKIISLLNSRMHKKRVLKEYGSI